jgi:NAD(P)H-hydrate epimerase
VERFTSKDLKKLWRASKNSNGEQNGQLTIIGGSSLFHGAPILSIKAASRMVDMVFFSSPEKSMEKVAARVKASLSSFIWVPWGDINHYIEKSDAVLLGPGFMRFKTEKVSHGKRYHVCDAACQLTRKVTKKLLLQYPRKKWVIDAGSLQVMDPEWIPSNAVVTPNTVEYGYLFPDLSPLEAADKYDCIVVRKGPVSYVYSKNKSVEIKGGNEGLTKGGSGDVQAGITAALLTKNEPFLAAAAAAYIVKAAADSLYKHVGPYFNSDDLADEVPRIMAKLV